MDEIQEVTIVQHNNNLEVKTEVYVNDSDSEVEIIETVDQSKNEALDYVIELADSSSRDSFNAPELEIDIAEPSNSLTCIDENTNIKPPFADCRSTKETEETLVKETACKPALQKEETYSKNSCNNSIKAGMPTNAVSLNNGVSCDSVDSDVEIVDVKFCLNTNFRRSKSLKKNVISPDKSNVPGGSLPEDTQARPSGDSAQEEKIVEAPDKLAKPIKKESKFQNTISIPFDENEIPCVGDAIVESKSLKIPKKETSNLLYDKEGISIPFKENDIPVVGSSTSLHTKKQGGINLPFDENEIPCVGDSSLNHRDLVPSAPHGINILFNEDDIQCHGKVVQRKPSHGINISFNEDDIQCGMSSSDPEDRTCTGESLERSGGQFDKDDIPSDRRSQRFRNVKPGINIQFDEDDIPCVPNVKNHKKDGPPGQNKKKHPTVKHGINIEFEEDDIPWVQNKPKSKVPVEPGINIKFEEDDIVCNSVEDIGNHSSKRRSISRTNRTRKQRFTGSDDFEEYELEETTDDSACSYTSSLSDEDQLSGSDDLDYDSSSSSETVIEFWEDFKTDKYQPQVKLERLSETQLEEASNYVNGHILWSEMPFGCKLCTCRFPRLCDLNEHMTVIHKGKKPYSCKTCRQKFTQLNRLRIHERRHTWEPIFKCDVCAKVIRGRTNFARHEKLHTEKTVYSCDICGLTFPKAGRLIWHKYSHKPSKEKFKCEFCGKEFVVQHLLKNHIRVHTGEGSVECKVCGLKLRTKAILAGHMKTHGFDKPYSCLICGKMFLRPDTLRIHSLIHTDARPHSCEICGDSFKQSSSLNSHMLTHSEKRDHECEICKKQFRWISSYRKHMFTHVTKVGNQK